MPLYGYDESSYQNGLDPAVVPGDFVHIKATGGDGYENPYWRDQLAAARNAGKRVSLYHFARDGYTGATADTEVAWFVSRARDVIDGTVMVVLDWEGDNVGDVAYCKAMLDGLQSQLNIRPVVYMSYNTVTSYDWSTVAPSYPLWEAAYVLGYQEIQGYNPPSGLADIPYWGGQNQRIEWQFTSSGLLNGWPNHLDLDEFFGTGADWDALCALIGQAPPATVAVYSIDESGNAKYFTANSDVPGVFGQSRSYGSITIHHWDAPDAGATYDGVCTEFETGQLPDGTVRQVSAHFVGEDGHLACLVSPPDAAWHAGTADGNATSIAIECDPNLTDAGYATIGWLVGWLRTQYGAGMGLVPHSHWVTTACPGDLDLARIDALSKRPLPTTEDEAFLYRLAL